MPYILLMLRRRRWEYYRHQLHQVDMRRTLLHAVLWLIFVFTAHTLAMVYLEGLGAGDAIWLTLTTVLTVGYGDYAAATPLGRVATVLFIYVGGIFVLFHFAGDYFEFRSERKIAILRGRWRWRMRDHVLVLNSPSINADRYVLGLVRELRRSRESSECPVQLLCCDYPEGLPDAFKDVGVVHYHGDASDPDNLDATDADKAAIIIVLAEHADDKRSDEITYDILHRLHEIGAKGRVIAECVHTPNRERLRRAGAGIVLRPIRFYPEIVVRAINSPGSEVILENLFTIRSDECIGFEVPVRGVPWAEVVAHLMRQKLGTAVGYAADGYGDIRCNPDPDELVDAETIYLIVKAERGVDQEQVRAALATLRSPASRGHAAAADC